MSYANFFTFGKAPELESRKVGNTMGWVGMGSRPIYRDMVTDYKQDEDAAKQFNAIMAGHDATTAAYVNQLKSIYDNYGKYAEQFGERARPIIDAIGGDIEELNTSIVDYTKLLSEIKPTMMHGVKVDPSATRTREEYMGNVAGQFAQAREAQKRNMASQGMNPYANTGASRQLSLAQAAGQTTAANSAYKDWREQYNRDMQAKQQAQAAYAGLEMGKGNMVMGKGQLRGQQLSGEQSIFGAQMGAEQAKAAGIEGLTGLAEARRAEALALGQQQQENQRYLDDVTQQLNAKKKHGGLSYSTW